MGPSGSGKTTLLDLLCGRITKGTITGEVCCLFKFVTNTQTPVLSDTIMNQVLANGEPIYEMFASADAGKIDNQKKCPKATPKTKTKWQRMYDKKTSYILILLCAKLYCLLRD